MAVDLTTVTSALNDEYVRQYPQEIARQLEGMESAAAASVLATMPNQHVARALEHMSANSAADVFSALPDDKASILLKEIRNSALIRIVGQFEPAVRDRVIRLMSPTQAKEVRRLLSYPEDSAGRLMSTRFLALRPELPNKEALRRVRGYRGQIGHDIFLVRDDGILDSRVEMRDIAITAQDVALRAISRPIAGAVAATASREEVVEKLKALNLHHLPVVDIDGRILGVIEYRELVNAVEADATLDIQTMVGASRDERALSSPAFTVRKRLPWLQINLATAFLASAVVGAFEGTIAQYTALAVLLPVVAGQSGNAGAQALAVTMRGLALREIGLAQWSAVVTKEVAAGFVNGLAVAATTSLGVFVWSGSVGLSMVIGVSMVISMVIAGLSGAMVPVILTRLGQDPAVASSIILTTVTDVFGFLSFLGIATVLSGML